jgi:MFS family permease
VVGTLQWATTSYVPLFTQVVLGLSAYWAGASVAPVAIGWPVASIIAGRLLLRTGPWPLVGAGSLGLVAGSLMIAIAPSVELILLGSVVLGFGMGMVQTPLTVTVQSAVGWGERGAVTALNQFARTIGGSVGVSLLGLLLIQPSGARLSVSMLSSSLHTVFWTLPAMAGAAVLLSAWMLIAAWRGRTAGGIAAATETGS